MDSGTYRLYPLSYEDIIWVAGSQCCGVYALGNQDNQGRFNVRFVGYSSSDLRNDLIGRIGTAGAFRIWHTKDGRAAFELACDLYHKFKPVGNFLHPERPRDTAWSCPGCERAVQPAARRYP